MAETISMEVYGKVPEEQLRNIYKEITPTFLTKLLIDNGFPTNGHLVNSVTISYSTGFPTQDLALKAFEIDEGIKFWGIASGGNCRYEKIAIKYLILEHIQKKLDQEGIYSEINIAGLNRETIGRMTDDNLFKGKFDQLHRISREKGNLEDTLMGIVGACPHLFEASQSN